MSRLFLHIYDYLSRRRVLCYLLMAGSFLLMLAFAMQVRFEEDVSRFFPDTDDARDTEYVFRHLKVKDRIIVMLHAADTAGAAASASSLPPDSLTRAAASLSRSLRGGEAAGYIRSILDEMDGNAQRQLIGFIYDNLPVFLPEADYARIDSLFAPGALDRLMADSRRRLASPAGVAMRRILPRDPLGLGIPALKSLQGFQLSENYTLYNNYIFSRDMSTLLLFITPRYGMGTTGKNEVLIDALEESLATLAKEHPAVKAEYFGGPSVSVYNARQIKRDTTLTLGIALLVIVAFITIVFRRRAAVPLIILPVAYGAAFALALIWWLKGSVSSIAIGAGAAIFGVALSYSIHVLSHVRHVASIRQLIRELAYPMTVGSFTTVGAFLGLLFTGSDILRDFGLFSALALIGTTLFCLVFLPHLLTVDAPGAAEGRMMKLIGKVNGYAFDRNRWLTGGILLLFAVCLFFSGKVSFDSNMMNLGFEPRKIKMAEERLNSLFESDNRTTLFVSTGKTTAEAIENYNLLDQRLDSLRRAGKVREYASARSILIPEAVQRERIHRWNAYWTPARRADAEARINTAARKQGFSEGAFDTFYKDILGKEYATEGYTSSLATLGMLDDWIDRTDSMTMLVTQVRITDESKEEVYETLRHGDTEILNNKTKNNKLCVSVSPCSIKSGNLVVFDRGYYANKWVSAIRADFDLVLYISSLLVFFALLLSYGRIELALMAFAPMAVSWVIILGIMAMGGIEFNIVNIILATFIFGLGDDFSIFIMDGLRQEYRTGKRMLASHKTAICFSAFTAIVGLGALGFAEHPALKSISLISILGMLSVVAVSYTILPVLFRLFISGPARKGHYPQTAMGMFVTVWFYHWFVVGCSLLIGVASVVILFPVGRERKKQMISLTMMYLLRVFLRLAWVAGKKTENPSGEDFSRPAVIVANHQSFIDILLMLSLSPKLVIVTANWVWNNPMLGRIARYADFVQAGEGYGRVISHLRGKVKLGYSVVVFPEGTRSADLEVHRFHKGAFYIAEQLGLDIVPVVLYGTGMVLSKAEPLRIKSGEIVTRILPRIPAGDASMGATYREKTKSTVALVRRTYREIREAEDTPRNPYFLQKLVTNYIYKGPVEEWYIRVKVRMEGNYGLFHRLVPREAVVTDIGCGYGMMAYMLHFLSPRRTLLGIDYDDDKIAVASHNFSRADAIRFQSGNALDADLPVSDVFILSDVLHYMDYASQEHLLEKCVAKLLPGGSIIIRDSNASSTGKQRLTRLTEFLSTRLTGFNKKEQHLCFPTAAQFTHFAQSHHLQLSHQPNDRFTSNMIYVMGNNTSK